MTTAVPDKAMCLRLMEDFGMLANIREHSLVVAGIAEQLVDGLTEAGHGQPVPDRKLVLAGALLHDIAKTPCLDGSCDHTVQGARICLELGYPEIAAIVAEHVILRDFDPQRYGQGRFTARELVYYADKRVRHDQVVSLDERLEYILEHYGKNEPTRHRLIQQNFAQCLELETHLFRYLSFAPAMIARTCR